MHHVWGLVSPVNKMTVVLFTECLCQKIKLLSYVLLYAIVVWYQSILSIFFRVTSLALGKPFDCPRAREASLKNLDKLNPWTDDRTITIQTTTKPCIHTQCFALFFCDGLVVVSVLWLIYLANINTDAHYVQALNSLWLSIAVWWQK